MGRKSSRAEVPTTMMHHVKEIRMRLLVVVLVLLAGMGLGYLFYEPLFQFIKAPLHGPLHYTSPSGSFNLVIEICLIVGAIAALPVAVYNVIMFIQPALQGRLSKGRIYSATILSLVLALAGAAFSFFVIIPLALEFFFKIQVNGLVALISASDYLGFVINVTLTFVIMFQLPLLMSFIDYVRPLPPKTLLKAEKYVILAGIIIAIIVPFAVSPSVQLLVASPIIVLYNISIVVVLIQHAFMKKKPVEEASSSSVATAATPPLVTPKEAPSVKRVVAAQSTLLMNPRPVQKQPIPVTASSMTRPVVNSRSVVNRTPTPVRPPVRQGRLITDIRRPAPNMSMAPATRRAFGPMG